MTFYRITVLKNGLVYDRQVERCDQMSIDTYVSEMHSHSYSLNIRTVAAPDCSPAAQWLWLWSFEDRDFAGLILLAYREGRINAHDLTALRRAWAALARNCDCTNCSATLQEVFQ